MYEGVRTAVELGVPVTIHAGEWPDRASSIPTIENAKYALDSLSARRIGHGIAIGKHPEILEELAKKKDVCIEVFLLTKKPKFFEVSS